MQIKKMFMDEKILAEGDALAKKLIDGYWQQLENGKAWNYFDYPPKYVRSDTWATKDQWIAFAKRCLKNKSAIIHAYDILLEAGCYEYFDSAHEYVNRWHKESGHDPEYFWNIISYFEQDDPIRQYWLGYSDPSEFDTEYTDLGRPSLSERTVLISRNDSLMCQYIAEQISNVFKANDPEQIEDYALPRMTELGALCDSYLSSEVIDQAKTFCWAYLEKDKEYNLIKREKVIDSEERSLWLVDDIALMAYRMGWGDFFAKLKLQGWYWNSLFRFDSDNSTLLSWSLIESNDVLLKRALLVMNYEYKKPIEGAIAWCRMRELSD